jgi:hypothetical protein
MVRERSAHGSISVDNVTLNSRGETLVKSKLCLRDQLVVEADVELVILLANIESGDTRSELVGWSQEKRQVNVGSLVGSQVIADPKDLDVANHLVDGAETELGHDGTELVGHIVEEVDDVLGSALELLTELRILSSNTNRASV